MCVCVCVCVRLSRNVNIIHDDPVPSSSRRPNVTTGQRDRRREHGRGGRTRQPRHVAMLRDRLAPAYSHVVASGPYVADDVGRVRTAPRPFTGGPAGDGQRARTVHVSGVQRAGKSRVVDRYAPSARHARGRPRPAGQPVPGTGAVVQVRVGCRRRRQRDSSETGRRQTYETAAHLQDGYTAANGRRANHASATAVAKSVHR